MSIKDFIHKRLNCNSSSDSKKLKLLKFRLVEAYLPFYKSSSADFDGFVWTVKSIANENAKELKSDLEVMISETKPSSKEEREAIEVCKKVLSELNSRAYCDQKTYSGPAKYSSIDDEVIDYIKKNTVKSNKYGDRLVKAENGKYFMAAIEDNCPYLYYHYINNVENGSYTSFGYGVEKSQGISLSQHWNDVKSGNHASVIVPENYLDR